MSAGLDRRASEGLHPPRRRLRFIGDVIVDLGYADRAAVDAAVAQAQESGRRTGEVLVENGTLTSDQLARVVAERFGVEHIDLAEVDVDMAAANLLNASAAKRYGAVPVRFVDERTLLVVMVDPGNMLAIDDMAIMTGCDIRPAVAPTEDVETLIAKLKLLSEVVVEEAAADEADEAEEIQLTGSDEHAPVIKLVHSLIGQGIDRGASDIHFEPSSNREIAVRFRVDGVLHEITRVPRRLSSGVVSRIKIMADLDIAERRAPQDGRVTLSIDGRHIDARVATLPLVGGEAVVLRVLDRDSSVLDLDKLGMVGQERSSFERSFMKPHGAVLVTGPTGSGKTTTLYGALSRLHTPDKSIITIEDPVEYELDGIKQMQINPKAGVTFATGLRSMMRADPDILMVGEVRDRETALIAVEAALTGHMVLTTLHTNDAPTAIGRLLEMGVESFLVGSAIECVVAQRLARVLCMHCKREVEIPGDVVRTNGFHTDEDTVTAWEPEGCSRCGGSGYRGRLGIYEVMVLDEELRRLAVERASADVIAEAAVRKGMRRLRDEGFEKVCAGLTSFAELARVTG